MKSHRAVAVYILDEENRVLLLLHKKLDTWLPPGGHVEDNELTHEAAIREVLEETGIEFDFIYDTAGVNDPNDKRARMLPHPLFVQLEDNGDHFHEDFVYLAKAKTTRILNKEGHEIGWFTLDEAITLRAFDNVIRHLIHIRDKILKEK